MVRPRFTNLDTLVDEEHTLHITRKFLDDPEVEDPSHSNVKTVLNIDDDRADDIVGYNKIVDLINKEVKEQTGDQNTSWITKVRYDPDQRTIGKVPTILR